MVGGSLQNGVCTFAKTTAAVGLVSSPSLASSPRLLWNLDIETRLHHPGGSRAACFVSAVLEILLRLCKQSKPTPGPLASCPSLLRQVSFATGRRLLTSVAGLFKNAANVWEGEEGNACLCMFVRVGATARACVRARAQAGLADGREQVTGQPT